ncbi:penicillin acylase family protein [Streptomyces jumonjinensis]|uniref:penicillin acylase family protein n=1 Tax=Streptomyces jumonjinensis TaxID=1945 RepID=UPI002B20AF4A|nr:penicillin acylase family protein [Streptomyces jumonjinensis]
MALATAAVTVQPTAADAPDGRPGDRATTAASGPLSAVIRYTEYGIPHITARDYTNLGFGSGWAQAADQVCVLADGFLTARAERSRHLGPDQEPEGSLSGARTNLTSDLYFQGLRDTRTAEKLFAASAPIGPGRDVKDLMRGWVKGYNAWLAQNRIEDPACRGRSWVRPITVADLALVSHALIATAGNGMATEEIVTAAPPTAKAARTAGAPDESVDPAEAARSAKRLLAGLRKGMGSNAVAFNGSTTANGSGLLLGNPHYPWQGGRRFWQAQQTIPGELNVAGGALLGSPIVNIGFNKNVAWSHTVSTGTPMNLRELTLDPRNPTVYLVDGKRERMEKRTVTVPVKGGAPVTRTQWWTRYGPVVTGLGEGLPLNWTEKTAYALGDPNSAHLRLFDTSLAFGKARTTGTVLDGLRRTQGLPWLNTIAADSRGGSLFTQSQVLPRITDGLAERCSTELGRATYPASGLAVLDGSRADCAPGTDKDAVQPGTFGPKSMPTLRNAPYAVNSNDSAWLAHPGRPLRGYERVFGDIDTARSLRTRGGADDLSAMAERGGLRVKDAQRLQFANRAPAGHMVAADAARACAALPGGRAVATDGATVDVSAACPVLRKWDRTTDADSRGALLFERFWQRLVQLVPEERFWKTPFSPKDPVRTPHTLNIAAPGVAQALADAVQELRAMKAELNAPWGEHHFVERNGTRIPVPGGPDTLGVWNMMESVWNPAGGGYTDVFHGSSYIQAVSWNGSGCPVARTLLTYGQSSNPLSPHSSDQTRLLAAEKWVTPRFCEKDILASPELKTVTVRERR